MYIKYKVIQFHPVFKKNNDSNTLSYLWFTVPVIWFVIITILVKMTKNGTFSDRFLKRKMSPKPSPRTNLIFYAMSHDIVIMWISLRATAVDIFFYSKNSWKKLSSAQCLKKITVKGLVYDVTIILVKV